MSNEEAVKIVSKALKEKEKNIIEYDTKSWGEGKEDGNDVVAQYAANTLVYEALKKVSSDNVSVIVVKFAWEKKKK